MTREEKKKIREKEKEFENSLKAICKNYGYKSVMGIPYKFVGQFLFEIHISTSLGISTDENLEMKSNKKTVINPSLSVTLYVKPVILDEIFWIVFDMYDAAVKQPKSFHVKGAFTANITPFFSWNEDFIDEENQKNIAEKILTKSNAEIEKYQTTVFNLESFEESIINEPNQYLNQILIKIAQKDYNKALQQIEICIAKGQTGGFAEIGKTILDYAKEHCKKHI